MIERALNVVVTPVSVSINAITARMAVCEKCQGTTDEVVSLNVVITELMKDVDQLKSTLCR